MDNTLARRIAETVRISGVSRSEFAKRLKVSQPFVSQMCSGAANPSDRTISDICDKFGVDEIWLRTGDGEPFPLRRSDSPGSGPLPVPPVGAAGDLGVRLAAALSRLSPEDYTALARFLLALLDKVQQLPPDPPAPEPQKEETP